MEPGNGPGGYVVINLSEHREKILPPTYAATLIGTAAGGSVQEYRPGVVVFVIPGGHIIEQTVRVIRHSNAEVAALYKRLGVEPPARLLKKNDP